MQKTAIIANRHAFMPWLKFLLIMKMVVILLTTFCMQVSASAYSQATVTLTVKDAQLKDVFNVIQKQTGYSFLYHENNELNSLRVDMDVEKMPVKEAIGRILNGTGFQYQITQSKLVLIQHVKNEAKLINPIKGSVVDDKGEPLVGVTVSIKNKDIATLTDDLGRFSINAEKGDVLIFSMVGMKPTERVVTDVREIVVTLNSLSNDLSEVVVVGYGTKKREEITGSISTVKGVELSIAPVGNITNTLAGRLAGLVSLQSSGQPGYDKAKLSIRGFGNPLVIIDGIEADFTTLDPNTVESISVLKDASASIYGARAGSGVILVTTKRGNAGKPMINFNTSYTLQSVTIMPKPVSAGQFAQLSREQHLQSGQPESTVPFTEEAVKKYYEATDPQYPNTNWYNVVFRNWAPKQQHNISVRGGSDNIKYYGFLGMLNQETMIKAGSSGYKRYNLISNIDAKISNQLSFSMNLATTYGIKKYPWRGLGDNANTAWEDYWNTQPVYPATLPDPTKLSWAVGSNTGGVHIMGNRDVSGYNDFAEQNIIGTVALNYNSNTIKGLTGKILMNYNQDFVSNKKFVRPLNFYTYDFNADKYTLAGSLGSKASLGQNEFKSRILTGQFFLGYEKKINQHLFALTAVHELADYYTNYLDGMRKDFLTPVVEEMYGGSTEGAVVNGGTTEMGRKSYIGRLSYNYGSRYLLDINFRADASAKFPKNKRWGYFPGISIGWRLDKENFLSRFSDIDELKLRLSYGTSGNDNVSNFAYLSGYKIADHIANGMTYLWGATTNSGIVNLGLSNPDLTWETMKIYNAGVDFALWKRKLYGILDVFYRERIGIPVSRKSAFPSTFGATLPPENINSLNNRGFEFKLGTTGSRNNWVWDISTNISWTRDKWMHFEENNYTDSTDIRTKKLSGRWTDVVFGYKTDGLFMSQAEIDNLGYNQDLNPTKPNTSLRPGDIKYVDVNGDGLIDRKDVVELGKGTVPRWMFGFNTSIRYKQFDLSALFQGAFGHYTVLRYYGGVYSDVVFKERWTPESTNRYALIPRLGGKGMGVTSDYNYKSAAYLRLKTFALGYSVDPAILKRIGLNQVRVYLAATNLITFDKLKKYNIDPEAPSGRAGHYYPQQKTISIGLNVTL